MKVLLVDDSTTMRRIQKTQLAAVGPFDIIEAEDGNAAYAALIADPSIDIILLDWNMPKMDGITFLKKVRAESRFGKTKIIMCTSEADKAKVMEALKCGANNYIVKPFTTDILREKLGL